MSKGKRYDEGPKLNITKVFAVIIAIAVIVMFIFMIKGLLTKEDTKGKITSESYFVAYKDNKWGVINSQGNNVIDTAYAEMLIIPNNKVGVFICTYDVNYETGEYKTKVLNEKNEQIFTQYDKVEPIQNKDKDNNILYEKDLLKVEKNGEYGLINLRGKQILSIQYEDISTILGVRESLKIKKDDKFGIVNSDGKVIIEPQYKDITLLGDDNKSGFIVKDETEKYGIVNYSNEKIIDIKYDAIEKIYANDLYIVTIDGKQKVINKNNEDVLTAGFDTIKQILSTKENAVIYTSSNKYGIMNLSGDVILKPEYDYLKEAKTGTFIAQKNNKYGIIDIEGKEKVNFNYTSISYNDKADIYVAEGENFKADILNNNLEVKVSGILIDLNDTKGYLKIKNDEGYKYYNFKFEEKQEMEIYPNRTLFLSKNEGKYGYVDKSGAVIVDYIYDDAMDQNDYGYAAVKKDGKWGSIDNKGNIVQEPIYNLDEYLLIDFIGRWHLGSDININYYNQL